MNQDKVRSILNAYLKIEWHPTDKQSAFIGGIMVSSKKIDDSYREKLIEQLDGLERVILTHFFTTVGGQSAVLKNDIVKEFNKLKEEL